MQINESISFLKIILLVHCWMMIHEIELRRLIMPRLVIIIIRNKIQNQIEDWDNDICLFGRIKRRTHLHLLLDWTQEVEVWMKTLAFMTSLSKQKWSPLQPFCSLIRFCTHITAIAITITQPASLLRVEVDDCMEIVASQSRQLCHDGIKN